MKTKLICAGMLGLLWTAAAGAGPTYYHLTRWGSVYKNLQKLEDKTYQRPLFIAGTENHYWVLTEDGSVCKDGAMIEKEVYKDMNPVAIDAYGDDYYVLTWKGAVYKNGKEIAAEGTYNMARDIAVQGSDYWVVITGGAIYKNGSVVNEGPYPDGDPRHIAVSGDDIWAVRDKVYKNREPVSVDAYLNPYLGVLGSDYYIFTSAGSVYHNGGDRVAALVVDRDENDAPDNIADVDLAPAEK